MRWVALLLVFGCQSELGGTCDDDDDCKLGLFCAKVGDLKDTCTAECVTNEGICRMRFGEKATCSYGYCALTSAGSRGDPCEGRCNPNTMKCRLEPAPPTCVPK